jgi:putative ABC transport system permease protein
MRYAGRSLRRSRGFTATAVAVLSISIGLAAAVFSFVDAVLLRPLPYPNSHALVMILDVQGDGPPSDVIAPGSLRDWREGVPALEQIAAFNLAAARLETPSGPRRLRRVSVTDNYFALLGVDPAHGRTFTPEDARPGAPPAVVLTDRFWRDHLDGDERAVGQMLRLDDVEHRVIGVMGRGFEAPDAHFLDGVDYWTVLRGDLSSEGRGARYMRAIARLAPGATIDDARQQLAQVSGRLAEREPVTNAGWLTTAIPLHDAIVRGSRFALVLLAAAAALVHLAASANLATLLLARDVSRQREAGLRVALGASPKQLMRMAAVEGVLLAIAGVVGGLLIALWAIPGMLALAPLLARADAVAFGMRTVHFAAALALVTGLAVSIAPGWAALSMPPMSALKYEGRTMSEGRRPRRLRSALVILEVAVAVVLLTAASLLGRSLFVLEGRHPGFSPDGVMTARIDLRGGHETLANELAVIAERVRASKGVEYAGFVSTLPLYGLNNLGFGIDAVTPQGSRRIQVRYRSVTPGYLEAMGSTLSSGRLLLDTDDRNAPGAVVANRSAIREMAGGGIGTAVRFEFNGRSFDGRIVGVIDDVRHDDLLQRPEPEIFVPYGQHPIMTTMFLATRASGRPGEVAESIRAAVRQASSSAVVEDVQPLSALVARSVAPHQLRLMAAAMFASTAVLLALVALSAVVTHGVNQRLPELKIRLALGAQPRDILGLILSDGLTLGLAGVALGGVVAWLGSRALAPLLVGVSPHDPVSFLAGALLLVGLAILAVATPAVRAARADPLSTLRAE